MRLYNGCPDSALQAKMNADDRALKRIFKSGLRPTYYPMEAQWLAFRDLTIVGEFRDTIQNLAHHLEQIGELT